MAITKGDVLTYLQGLSSPSQINRRLVIGQYTGWPGSDVPDLEIPPLVAADGGITPGLVADVWGEIGHAEDAAHWTAGDNLDIATEIPNAIAGLIAYWNAGSLISVTYTPGHPITGDRFHTDSVNVANLINGTATCVQWREGVLATGQTYAQLLDYHAAYLQELEDAGVVVIYRPFIEMDGGAANQWWEHLSAADYVDLWQYTYTYLTTTKGLSNLLWLWATLENKPNSLTWYPGDAFVDLVGFDYYPPDGVIAVNHPTYLQRVAQGKPVLLGEIGLQESPYLGTPIARDVDAFVERIRAQMPLVVGAIFWPDPYAIRMQTNRAVGMANTWLVTQPVPVLELPPVASFTATPVPATRTMVFADTSV